ncbi:YnfU family zinc-binding protein [Serratia sp. NPDC078593]|uniref:YnfU family zinc-binding protein n=1 Tax=unclassified Serratia (in: enterobacteria) TaxID=2647522 RepID=UPI0037CCF7F2
MTILSAFKMFRHSSIDVTCPECSRVSAQERLKLMKNMTMICPNCGHYFRKNETPSHSG